MIESIVEWFAKRTDDERRERAREKTREYRRLYSEIGPSAVLEGVTLCAMRPLEFAYMDDCGSRRSACGSCHGCGPAPLERRCYDFPPISVGELCVVLEQDEVQRSFLSIDHKVMRGV